MGTTIFKLHLELLHLDSVGRLVSWSLVWSVGQSVGQNNVTELKDKDFRTIFWYLWVIVSSLLVAAYRAAIVAKNHSNDI